MVNDPDVTDDNAVNLKDTEEKEEPVEIIVPDGEPEEGEELSFDEQILKYVALVEECEPQLTKARQKDYFAKLEKDYSKIKRALEQCIAIGTDEYISFALRITGTLLLMQCGFILIFLGGIYRFWFVTGRQQEGYSILSHCHYFLFFDFSHILHGYCLIHMLNLGNVAQPTPNFFNQ